MRTLVSRLIPGGLTAAILMFSGWAQAQDPTASRILDKVKDARPAHEDMGFYRLDWARSLPEAKRRARKESRPILFIWLTNKTGPTDFFSGHC